MEANLHKACPHKKAEAQEARQGPIVVFASSLPSNLAQGLPSLSRAQTTTPLPPSPRLLSPQWRQRTSPSLSRALASTDLGLTSVEDHQAHVRQRQPDPATLHFLELLRLAQVAVTTRRQMWPPVLPFLWIQTPVLPSNRCGHPCSLGGGSGRLCSPEGIFGSRGADWVVVWPDPAVAQHPSLLHRIPWQHRQRVQGRTTLDIGPGSVDGLFFLFIF